MAQSKDFRTTMASAVKGLAPDVKQIYPIVNEIFNQVTGRDDVTAIDTNSLVAMGQQLDDLGKKDTWLNGLAKRIGITIDDYRVYNSKYAPLARTALEWGAYVQKFRVDVPDAVQDDTYDVGHMDGKSVDQWIITNPHVKAKIFGVNTPFSFRITIQDVLLNEAFLSSSGMASLITAIFGKIRNKKEIAIENLSRLSIVNLIINMTSTQHFHLVTIYNSLLGRSISNTDAKTDADFLRWANGFINNISDKLETASVLYNAEKNERFTPKKLQHFYALSDFMTMVDTVIMYSAHNPSYITANPDVRIPFWQGSGTATGTDWESITKVEGTNKDGATVQLNNLIGIIFDHDSVGTFRQQERVRTTPINARAEYYNTFWHENPMYFNDLGENCVAFFLD